MDKENSPQVINVSNSSLLKEEFHSEENCSVFGKIDILNSKMHNIGQAILKIDERLKVMERKYDQINEKLNNLSV